MNPSCPGRRPAARLLFFTSILPPSRVPAWNVCLFSGPSDSASRCIFSWSQASVPKSTGPNLTDRRKGSQTSGTLLRRILATPPLPHPAPSTSPPPPAPLKPSPSSYGACHRSYCLVNDTLPGLAFSFFGKWLQCRSVSSSVFTVPIKSLFSRNSSRHLCVSRRRPPPRPPCATLWHGSDRTKGAVTPLPKKGFFFFFFYNRLPVKSSETARVQTRRCI